LGGVAPSVGRTTADLRLRARGPDESRDWRGARLATETDRSLGRDAKRTLLEHFRILRTLVRWDGGQGGSGVDGGALGLEVCRRLFK
jgi:hypothetical protein